MGNPSPSGKVSFAIGSQTLSPFSRGDCVAMGELALLVILSEAKNLIILNESTIEILRLPPQNDTTTQSLTEGGGDLRSR
jgi:hypothetical protein